MGQVRDLTADAIGKVYRIQNDDGAYIEGTLDTLSFIALKENSIVIDVIVTFKELQTSYKEGAKRLPIYIYTRPQHEAVLIEDEFFDPGEPNPVVVTKGPGINGSLYPKPRIGPHE